VPEVGAVSRETDHEVLDGSDGVCLRASVALGYLELDSLTLFEAAVAVHLDGGVVHEHIPTTVNRDEAVPLVGVEPLDCALSHTENLPLVRDRGHG
jgi:hypothetical protein